MKKTAILCILTVGLMCGAGCSKAKGIKDRSKANEMYQRICRLTEEYTEKLQTAPDSADWAAVCAEYEESLDKVSLSYPPDTDLLLTEGQNDTIHSLLKEYVRVRQERIYGILYPEPTQDSLTDQDSMKVEESSQAETNG